MYLLLGDDGDPNRSRKGFYKACSHSFPGASAIPSCFFCPIWSICHLARCLKARERMTEGPEMVTKGCRMDLKRLLEDDKRFSEDQRRVTKDGSLSSSSVERSGNRNCRTCVILDFF